MYERRRSKETEKILLEDVKNECANINMSAREFNISGRKSIEIPHLNFIKRMGGKSLQTD